MKEYDRPQTRAEAMLEWWYRSQPDLEPIEPGSVRIIGPGHYMARGVNVMETIVVNCTITL